MAETAQAAREQVIMGAKPLPLALFVAMRPRQWAKNFLLFGGLIFSGSFAKPELVLRSFAAFALFCALSSGVYLLNDVRDRERDALHPEKSRRPIACGRVSVGLAVGMAVALLAVGIALGFALDIGFGAVGLLYLVLQGAYTYALKQVVILDVFLVAAGFVLRALAGAVVLDVRFSPWLFLCTMMLALFLGFGKRRHELLSLGGESGGHRNVLREYTASLLDHAVVVSAACTVMSYALYTIQSTTGRSNPYLMLTIPFVLYGVLRYLYHLYSQREGGSPDKLLFQDPHLLLTVGLWVLVAILAMLLGKTGVE
ncbi:MAG: decaprenyl-phosphate phosphoribosyltransferase [Fimbriimonadales bacterium]